MKRIETPSGQRRFIDDAGRISIVHTDRECMEIERGDLAPMWLTGAEAIVARLEWEVVATLQSSDERYVMITSGLSKAVTIARAELERERAKERYEYQEAVDRIAAATPGADQ